MGGGITSCDRNVLSGELVNLSIAMKVKSLSCVRLLATPWTAAHQAPLYMGFSRQEYWGGLPVSSPDFELEENENKKKNRLSLIM